FQLQAGVTVNTLSLDCTLLAFATTEEKVRLWNVPMDKELRTLASDVNATDLAFSPDGKVLATMTADHTIQLWDTGTGQELRRMQKEAKADGQNGGDLSLPVGRSSVPGLVFSPDGRILASVENKGTLRFNVGVGAFAPGDDIAIRLWHVASGKLIRK